MTLRTITLTERRPVVKRVPRADAADLATRFRHVVELSPTADRGRYRVVVRGFAGWFSTPSMRWVLRPKLGWNWVERMAGWDAANPDSLGDPSTLLDPSPLADVLARRLAELMRQRAAAGLVREYTELAAESGTVRGRVDFVELARRAAPQPTLFPVVADEFTADVAWNRVPRRAAGKLLARPGLSPGVRAELAAADRLFAEAEADTSDDLDSLAFDVRTEDYRPLIRWCRVVLGAAVGDGFLVNLEQLFEAHVERLLAGPGVAFQRPIRVAGDGALTFRPDVQVLGKRGETAAVWDAKWKRLGAAGPDPADAHQVLAYAAMLGCRRAGLIYPGRRFAVRTWETPAGVTLTAVRAAADGAKLRRVAMGRHSG